MSSKLPKATLNLKQVPTYLMCFKRETSGIYSNLQTFNVGFLHMGSKKFLVRQEVLKLYREIFRTLKQVQDETTKADLREWARADFRNNMHHTDETAIKAMLHHGQKSLRDLKKSLSLSKS